MIFGNFDSRKLVNLTQYWKPIKDGIAPPPIAMSLDLGNRCQNNCYFCNAQEVNPKKEMDDETFEHVLDFIKISVRSVCIAGGKESCTNKKAATYIERIIEETCAGVGLITNGVQYMEFHPDMRFLNVSINAGDAKTYGNVCGQDNFDSVIENIGQWVKDGQIVTYKVMITDRNKDLNTFIKSVENAEKLGCKNVLFRYAGNPWFESGENSLINISCEELDMIENCMIALKKHHAINIVFPIDRTDRYSIKETPKRCIGALINVVVTADGEVYGCSDHRGNPKLYYCHISELAGFWNSEKHWEIVKSVNPQKCPRCSFAYHSKVIDEFVFNDHCNQYFI